MAEETEIEEEDNPPEDNTDEQEEEDPISSVVDMGSPADKPEFTDADTPTDGRVLLDDPTKVILDEIDRLEQEKPDGFRQHLEPGEVDFLPVMGYSAAHLQVKYTEAQRGENGRDEDAGTIGGRDLAWWTEDSITPRHTTLLINPVTISQRVYRLNDEMPLRDIIRCNRGEQFVFADSGGFQFAMGREVEMTYDLNQHSYGDGVLHPYRILEWQLVNGDVGAVIDVPPFDYDNGNKPRGDSFDDWIDGQFQDCLDQTKKNAQYAAERYKEIDYDGFGLVGVIHALPRTDGGDLIEAHKKWHNSLDEVYDFEGWTFGSGVTDNPGYLAVALAYAAEHIPKDKFLHILGRGTLWTRAMAKLYAEMTGTHVTHDGSGYNVGSQYSTFYIPGTYMRKIRITEREGEDESKYEQIAPDTFPCSCIVCNTVERAEGGSYLMEETSTERSYVMNLHNLSHMMRKFQFIDAFVGDVGKGIVDGFEVKQDRESAGSEVKIVKGNQFWRVLSAWYDNAELVEIYYAMQFIIKAIEEGIDAAHEDFYFSNPFDNRALTIGRSKRQSVFGWQGDDVKAVEPRRTFETGNLEDTQIRGGLTDQTLDEDDD